MSDAVLLPVYNEAATVCDVLDAVRSHFSGEVIVVDDGSTDGTHTALVEREDVTLIAHGCNQGYGRALSEGFALAAAMGVERLITMDCDGQHEPAHIQEFLQALKFGPDLVSGSRYLPDSLAAGTVPPERREVNRRITAEINKVTGWDITDAFCGFKAYNMDSLREFRPTEPGYGMPMQLWAHAFANSWRVSELPVERIYLDDDRSFGAALDDHERRFAYYMEVWRRAQSEEKRWSM